jgi:hypothetical protein
MIAAKPIVGHSYFMWVDEPYWGIRKELPEDSNYGLLNENDEPYPLVDVFARMRPPVFSRSGREYSVRNHGGMELRGRIGGRQMIDAVSLHGAEIGSWNAMLQFEDCGKPVWCETARVVDVDWNTACRMLTIRAEGVTGEIRFAVTHEMEMDGVRPSFRARCAKIENIGRADLKLERIYFRQYASYAMATVNKAQVPSLWKEPKRAEWNDPATGRRWGLWTNAKDADRFFRYYVSSKDGSVHPDAGFKPHESVVIAPGAVYVPPRDCSWAMAEADSTDHSKEAKVK